MITEQQEQEFNIVLKEPCQDCGCNYCICEDTEKHKQEVKIGNIFVNTWGYEQTNKDFYKVVGLTKKSVKVRQLKQKTTETGFMSGTTIPLNEFKEDSEILTKRLKHSKDGRAYIIMSYGWCDLWEGKPESCSWYA